MECIINELKSTELESFMFIGNEFEYPLNG